MSQFPNASGPSSSSLPHDAMGEREGPVESARSGEAAKNGGRVPDPGSRGARLIAFLAVCTLVPTVVFFQQCEGGIRGSAAAAPATAAVEHLPDFDQFSISGRILLKVAQLLTGPEKSKRAELLQAIDPNKSTMMGAPQVGLTEQVRFAIASGELESGTDAIAKLDAIDFDKAVADWKPDPKLPDAQISEARESHAAEVAALRHDAETLKLIYSGKESEIPDEDEARLIDRQGWWGRVASSYGKGDKDPMRLDTLDGGGKLIAGLFVFGPLILGSILAGFVLAIVMLVMISQGKIRRKFVAPIPGGSVYLETLAVFILGFVSLALVKYISSSMQAALIAQWMLVPIIFWPLLRGVPWGSFRRSMGFTSGGGVFKEIGCGIFAYLAGLPLFLFATLVALLLLMLQSLVMYGPDAHAPAPDNKVLDLITKADTGTLVLFFCLATFWAPLVEESVFRGAFFRHLRSRVPMAIAGIGSAVVFGAMHGYPIPLLLPVMTLGFNFALMREWRGSLIAPMTAHMLHNGTLVGMMVTVMSAIR